MFKTFFLGGYESTTAYNRQGEWIDLIDDTWHQVHAREDYQLLRGVDIGAARDAIRWPLVDLGGRYDFSSVEPLVAAARAEGVEVVWDLFHYGYPHDENPLSDTFCDRFARYCRACAEYLRPRIEGTLWFTPVNEPSFFAWAAGEAGNFAPYLAGHGRELKVALVRAAIAGIDAIRAVDPGARFLHADPVCRVVPANDDPGAHEAAHHFNYRQVYESWDMLCGRLRPELGGSRAHLDVVGINYYWNCQWVHGEDGTWLDPDDPRRAPLRDLVRATWERYGGEVVISETSHWGDQRANWLRELTDDIACLLREGVPLGGVCLYPIIGMRDWHAPRDWMPMGLWDIDCSDGMCRVVHAPMLEALRAAQGRVEQVLRERDALPLLAAARTPRVLAAWR